MVSTVIRVRCLRFYIALHAGYAKYRRDTTNKSLEGNGFELRHVEFEEQLENMYLLLIYAPLAGDEVLANVQAGLIEIMSHLQLHFFSSMRSYITRERIEIAEVSDRQQVTPGLWIGSTIAYKNMLDEPAKFPRCFIATSSNALTADSPPIQPKDEIIHLNLDQSEGSIDYDAIVKQISEKFAKFSTILVFCGTGISWSSAVCIAYTMKTYSMPFQEALTVSQAARLIVEPSRELTEGLMLYEQSLKLNANAVNIFG